MLVLKKIFAIILATVSLFVIIYCIVDIVKLHSIDTKEQKQTLIEYSKSFDIEQPGTFGSDVGISWNKTNNEEGCIIKFDYKNTTLFEEYDTNLELIEKSYSNNIKNIIIDRIARIWFVIFIFVLSIVYIFFKRKS